jgi:hypothetical protein
MHDARHRPRPCLDRPLPAASGRWTKHGEWLGISSDGWGWGRLRRVASQLTKLKSMLPVADATAILLQRPHAILELDLDVRHAQAVKLRAAFAPVFFDTCAARRPSAPRPRQENVRARW